MANDSTMKFRADISQLKAAMQEASRSIRVANSEFKAATAGMDNWSKSSDGLNAKIKQLNSVLEAQKKQLALANDELAATVKAYGENSAEADRARIKVNNYEAAVKTTEKQLNDYEKELKEVEEGLDDTGDASEDAGRKAKDSADGFTVMKGALADLVADGIRLAINELKDLAKQTFEAGSNFEAAMSQVAAVSGASEEEIAALTAKAKEMGESTKFSASESAEAFNYMAMAGWKTEDMINGISGIMNLAAASGADLATTSDIVTDALTAMGYGAEDAGKLADVMAAASSNANTNVEMMGQTFQYAAPIVGALGYNMEDTAVAIGLMANAGIKGEKSGTALRSILTRLSAPPKECADAMEKLGVSLTDSEGNMKDLDTVMQDLREAFADLDETEQTATAKAIAGQEAMSGLLAIVNAAPKDFDKLTKAVEESNGAAEVMAGIMNDNVAGQITLLQSKIEGIMIQIYEKAAPKIREAIDLISKALDDVDWDAVADAVGDFLQELVNGFVWLLQNSDKVITALKTIGTVLGAVFVVNKVSNFIGSIKTLVGSIKGVTTAVKGLGAATSALPIAAVVAAGGALVAGLLAISDAAEDAARAEYALSEEELAGIEATREAKAAYDELNEARQTEADSINAEYGYVSELKDEYNGLIDKNGEVKEGYEDRAEFILNELSQALGIEKDKIQELIGENGKLSASIDEVIQKKQAEAILAASENQYAEAVQKRGDALQDLTEKQALLAEKQEAATKAQDDYNRAHKIYQDLLKTDPLQAQNYWNAHQTIVAANDEAQLSLQKAEQAVKDAETTYSGYNSTIKNYEGLSAAIISGDANKINYALLTMSNNFQTHETATRTVLENQLADYEEHYEALKKAVETGMPGVTQAEVDAAEKMVKMAKNELDWLPPEAEESGKEAGEEHAKGIESTKGDNKKAGAEIRKNAANGAKPNGDMRKTGKEEGSEHAAGVRSTKGDNKTAGKELAQEAKKGADTKDASTNSETSGKNFGQGFINGIGSLMSQAWNKAKELAKSALGGLKKGQQEGSPSKLTFKSGVFFTQGYINGIASMQKGLVNTVKGMVSTTIKELNKMSGYNFSTVAENASTKFAETMASKTDYMLAKMSYQNEKKLAEFDKEINKLESKKKAATDKLQAASTKKQNALQTASDKKQADLQKKIDNTKDKAAKKRLQNQLKAEKANVKKQINAEKASVKKQIAASEKSYNKLIATQEKYKNAYSDASAAMLDEFSAAINDYQSKAQALIDDTINGITDKYNERYDELINKQDSLINKLKSAGDLFEISGAGVITVNDLKAQTKEINDYAKKLQKIKGKVSAELFDQIASYDMAEGSAFIDQLLAMSAKDLDAYNKAYTEKMKAAQKAGENIYKADFTKLAKDYRAELKTAFKGLDKQLEKLGKDAMKGFVNGLTKNTDYMDKNVKTFVKSMVSTFKKELKIKSPSRVMFGIGEFTGEGFDAGLMSVVKSVQNTARSLAASVSTPLDALASDFSGVRSSVMNGPAAGSSTSVVNNYNLVQNNNSPKSLSALETYQARRRQIAMMKAATQNA